MAKALPPPQDVAAMHAALCQWFESEGRSYPWRHTTDPYAILVSEVMLQQTRIATVLERGYYARWMEAFPDPATLAAAPEEQVLRAWEGLGYYSRARNLQRAARHIMDHFGGVFPRDPAAVAELPGVGRYTAGAVCSFAWDMPQAIVDGNVARVLTRWLGSEVIVNTPAGLNQVWAWAEALLHRARPRIWNSALMELGQRCCTPRSPTCLQCPVRPWCRSAGPGADSLPRKNAARATVQMEEHALWTRRGDELLLSLGTGTRRRGLWHLPLRAPNEIPAGKILHAASYAITHHKVALTVHEAPQAAPVEGETWHSLTNLPALPMPGPIRRAVDACLAAESGRGNC